MRFFQHLRTLTDYEVFPSWQRLMGKWPSQQAHQPADFLRSPRLTNSANRPKRKISK